MSFYTVALFSLAAQLQASVELSGTLPGVELRSVERAARRPWNCTN